jgi:flavin reductase (DIM6/NTAB) family NADH-FMN oxidoreductase RutF
MTALHTSDRDTGPGDDGPTATPAEQTSQAAGVDRATFFALMGAFPTGVTVVTTLDADGVPRGLTSNAFSSVSAEPPLLLVCVDKRSQTLPALQARQAFVVNFLAAGRGEVSNTFASKATDKFAGLSWNPSESAGGSPILANDALAYAECLTEREIDAGDHVILIGRVVGGQAPAPDSDPLTYFRRTYGSWGAA